MPVVSKMELGRELMQTLQYINIQIAELIKAADELGTSVYKMRNTQGDFLFPPMLAAKAQILHSLAMVNQK